MSSGMNPNDGDHRPLMHSDHAQASAKIRESAQPGQHRKALYTPEERVRRDSTKWTLVQGILAPIQFLVFGVSVVLVLQYLSTGEGAFAADVSILLKTALLYTIMVTGAIWEKVVFGRYLFAPAFYWEDVFSMLVIALHTSYVVMLLGGYGTVDQRMLVALAGYAAYVINAGQFLLKLRAARLDEARQAGAERTQPQAAIVAAHS